MSRKKIAVIFGGNSTEYEVSLQSAFSVFQNINPDSFDVVPIGITRSGEPNMMKGIGLSFPEMLEKLIGLYVE